MSTQSVGCSGELTGHGKGLLHTKVTYEHPGDQMAQVNTPDLNHDLKLSNYQVPQTAPEGSDKRTNESCLGRHR